MSELQLTLEAARVNAGLTQADAAERLGITRPTLRSWEKRKTFPNAIQIEKIEKVYGIEAAHIRFS